jgi:hypothetical protein
MGPHRSCRDKARRADCLIRLRRQPIRRREAEPRQQQRLAVPHRSSSGSGHPAVTNAEWLGISVTSAGVPPACTVVVGRRLPVAPRIVRRGYPSKMHGARDRFRRRNVTPALPAPGLGTPPDPPSSDVLQIPVALAVDRVDVLLDPPHPTMTIATMSADRTTGTPDRTNGMVLPYDLPCDVRASRWGRRRRWLQRGRTTAL